MLSNFRRDWDVHEGTANNGYGQSTIGDLIGNAFISVVPFTKSVDQTDVRFADATHFGLTKDNTILGGNYITDGVKTYIVEYALPETRQSQLYLREVI